MFTKLQNKFNQLKNERISPVLASLLVLNSVCMLIANIIAAKTFPVFNISDLTIVLPCAVIIFPVTYILSDVFSEVYGYKWSRRSAWISFGMNLLMVIFFELAILMPGTTDLSVLHSTWFLLAASLTAYMIGDLMNDIVFKKLKERDIEKGFIKRAMLSSLAGEFCDSLIYIPLGMHILPKLFMGFAFMSWKQVAICIILQPICKVLYELVISPVTYTISKKLKKFEAKEV